mgnify:CR=1 FL=1
MRVFLDTNVLYGGILNDLILRIAECGLIQIAWTEKVLEELETNLIENSGIAHEVCRRRVQAMRRAFPEANVVGYKTIESYMTCDPKDRHVLAGAVVSQATHLLTFNLKDFPPESTADMSLIVQHPDVFLDSLLTAYPQLIIGVLQQQEHDYKHPPLDVLKILEFLSNTGVPNFALKARRKYLAW